MTDETRDASDVREALLDEVELLREVGLASLDPKNFEVLSRLAREAHFVLDGQPVTAAAIKSLVQAGVGQLDDDAMETSAAYLMGLGRGQSLAATMKQRMDAAAAKRGVKVHSYSGRPPKGGKSEDMAMIADQVLAVHAEAVARLQGEDQRRRAMPHGSFLVPVEPPSAVRTYMGGMASADWLAQRRETSVLLWETLLKERDAQLARIGPLPEDVCIFASGSYGRDEAMEHSDLDLFLIDDVGTDDAPTKRLDKFELGSTLTLIDRTRAACGIQRFSQGGFYQQPQSFREMRSRVGHQAESTAPSSARILLLANSKCFANEELYAQLRARMFDEYWRENPGDNEPLVPLFLINDLRRLWLSMLIDYEHFYPKETLHDGSRVASTNRLIAGYKLVVAQKLGCYTPILALLERSSETGLSRAAAEEVMNMTTVQRLELLEASADAAVARSATDLRELYGQYLAFSNCDKPEMQRRVRARGASQIREHFNRASTLILAILWAQHARIPDVARFALV